MMLEKLWVIVNGRRHHHHHALFLVACATVIGSVTYSMTAVQMSHMALSAIVS